jgi:hypothetical protein
VGLARAFDPVANSAVVGAELFAAELGLPRGPLVFSGHQAIFWHPGVLVKRFAATTVAAKLGAHAVWLVVDQDATEAARIELPSVTPDGTRSSTALTLPRALRGSVVVEATPSAARPTLLAADAASLDAPPSLTLAAREAIAVLSGVLNTLGPRTSQAVQVSDAIEALLAPVCEGTPPISRVFASDLPRTTLFRELCRRMLADPVACTRAYNQAVREHPGADLRPLECGPGRVELPLWKLGPASRGSPRERVLASELEGLLGSSAAAGRLPALLPRALLMTAMVRLAGARIFIHGLGGEKYDPAMERWLSLWLADVPGLRLAPACIASANLYLDLEGSAPATTQRARNAEIQRLRRVQYDPLASADGDLEAEKRRALAEIQSHPRRSEARRAAYLRLTSVIERHRAAHAMDLEAARAGLARLLETGKPAGVPDVDPALRRDWPFFLYSMEALRALRASVDRALG